MKPYRITLHFLVRGKRRTHTAIAWARHARAAANAVHWDYANRGELGHCLGYTSEEVKQGEAA